MIAARIEILRLEDFARGYIGPERRLTVHVGRFTADVYMRPGEVRLFWPESWIIISPDGMECRLRSIHLGELRKIVDTILRC